MPYTPQAANFSDILIGVRDRLVAATGLDPFFVAVAANDEYPTLPFDSRWIVLRPYGLQPFTNAGAGRRARPVTRLLRIYLYSRSSLDRAGDDIEALTGDAAHFDFEEQTIDFVDGWFPANASGEPLTIEPLHLLDAANGPPTRKADYDVGTIRSHIDVECKYVLRNRTPLP